jgi:hypothetical protein
MGDVLEFKRQTTDEVRDAEHAERKLAVGDVPRYVRSEEVAWQRDPVTGAKIEPT